MDRERFLRVKELFQRALSWPEGERQALLAEATAGDAELAAEVGELLRHAAAAGSGYLDPALATAHGAVPASLVIPGFRVLERLAEGGSGTVFRAEQERPRREVALKVLRLDALGPGQVARFEREATILAGLDHPGIARVIEAGVLALEPVPLPWIALEFVHGATLDEFVRERRPRPEELLALFVEVCEAVEHAHAQGVVHRDLKPSNVMVDRQGRPRVLDFGVARACTAQDLATVERTRTGTLIGTLAYMAPEQARGEREPTPAADVYALGTMLFELLTGRLPLPVDDLGLLDVVRIVTEQEPEPLRRLRPDLPHDLETILAKTLEKEPARRYRRAGELAADLRRLLADRPVLARRPTAIYQARKFVRRNRALTLATLAVLAALSVGLGLALANLRTSRQQTALANRALDMFGQLLLDRSLRLGFGEGDRGYVEGLLGLVETQIQAGSASRELRSAQASLLYELANLDQARGQLPAMRARLLAARDVREALIADEPSDLVSRTHLSQIFAKLGEAARDEHDLPGRDAWFARALALDEALVREHPGEAELVEDLGWSLERVALAAAEGGDHATAARLHERRLADALELVRREPENWKYLLNLTHALYYVSGSLDHASEPEPAVAHMRECVRVARRLHELEPGRRDFLYWLADVCRTARALLIRCGHEQEAELLAREAFLWSEKLVSADSEHAEHIELLRLSALELAWFQEHSGDREAVAATAARLRATLRQIAGVGEPLGVAGLEAAAAELEGRALAAR